MYIRIRTEKGNGHELLYNRIGLGESESRMRHVDEGTMKKHEIGIWLFFNELKQNANILYAWTEMLVSDH